MSQKVDTRKVRQRQMGRWELPPGAIMVALWLIGMVLFLSFAMTLHLVASVLAELYVGG